MPALNTNDYAYIIPPSAQFRDLNGEPYSAGFVEFYKHGTSEKYITYADWAGSFNPFRIPLNSQGRGIAIAEKDVILDMYVYNYLGNLAYSRLNVRTTEDQDGAPLRFTSSDGSIVITRTDNIVDLKVFHDEKIFGSAEADSVGDNGLIEFDNVDSGDITVVSAGTLRIGAGKLYHVTVALEFNTGTINPLYCDCQLVDSEHTVHKFTLDASRTKQMIELSWDAVSSSDTFQLFIQAPSIFTVTSAELYIHSVNPVVGGSTPQLQSDWNVTDTDSPAYIKNKPDLSIYAQIADLAAVAFSGDYEDLSNKPDLSVFAKTVELAGVAFSGSYEDLTNKPDLSVYARIADLAAVAFSGAYSDLSGTPDLSAYVPTSALCPNWVSGEAVSDYTYKWYNGKVYRNRRTYEAGSYYSTVLPSNTLARVWVEVPGTLVGNTLYHYFAANPTLNYQDVEALIGAGYNLVLIGNDSHFDSYEKAFTLIGKGSSYSTDYPNPYFCFAALNADGSGMIMRVIVNRSYSGNPPWFSPSASFGKIYTAGTGISLTGPNNTEINCTLDPFPAHTAADAGKVITVGGQNQLLWRKLSYNELSDKPTQVQSDWDQTDDTQVDFIKNKPNAIPIVGGTDISIVEVDNQLVVTYTGSGAGTGVDDVTVNGSSVLNANHVAVIDLTPYALISSLAAVATSGAYSDLSGTPDLSVYALISSLAAVATSGDYTDLTNKPDLSVYALAASLASVATSGSYADLSNKPDLSVYALASSLAAVATSGDYNDLSNKPTIPTITYTTSQEVTDILADLT